MLAGFFLAWGCAAADEEGWIEIAGNTGHLQIEAEVNGESALILLDTGASTNAMTREFAERAGIDMRPERSARVSGLFGNVPDRELFRSGSFEVMLGDRPVSFRDFLIVPASSSDLIIGRALFNRVAVQIDYPNHRMRLFPSGALAFESNVEFRRGNYDEPLVRVDLQGRRAWLMVDTGSNGVCLLRRMFVRRYGLDEYAVDDARLTAWGISRAADVQLLAFDEVALGPFRFEQFLAGYVPEGREAGLDERLTRAGSRLGARPDYQGIIGYDLLRNFVVTMDLGEGRFHLYPP